jgi:hypothetical protein
MALPSYDYPLLCVALWSRDCWSFWSSHRGDGALLRFLQRRTSWLKSPIFLTFRGQTMMGIHGTWGHRPPGTLMRTRRGMLVRGASSWLSSVSARRAASQCRKRLWSLVDNSESVAYICVAFTETSVCKPSREPPAGTYSKSMSVLPKSRLPMRIIALPLTGAVRGPRHTENPSPLVYYHFQMRPKAEKRRDGWADWATGKAASVWAQFGTAPENSWKVCRSILSNASMYADCARVCAFAT